MLIRIDKNILTSLIKLSVPIALTNSIQVAYQLINIFWIGRLGANAVAAISVSFPVVLLMMSLASGLSIAGSVLIAQHMGAGDFKAINRIAGQALLVVVGVSFVISIAGWFATPFILTLMGVTGEIYKDACFYMQLTFIGMVFSFAFMTYQSTMRGLGEVKNPFYIVLLAVTLNLILDPLLIFGYANIPSGGIGGAARATLITQILSASIAMFLLFRNRHSLHLQLGDFVPSFKTIKLILVIGMPASIQQSIQAISVSFTTILVAAFGTVVIAAYGIGFRVLTFVIIPALSISMALSTLAGQSIGAGDKHAAREMAITASWASFFLLGGVGVIFFIFATPIINFFVPDDQLLITESATVLRYMSVGFGAVGVQLALMGFYRGAGDTAIAMFLSAGGLCFVQIPLSVYLSKYSGLRENGLWLSFPLSTSINLAISIFYFKSDRWKRISLVTAPHTGESSASVKTS